MSLRKGQFAGEKNPRYIHELKPWPCLYCGKVFRPHPWKVRVGQGKFCSQLCVQLYKAVIVHCYQCGVNFRIPPSRFKKYKRFFCCKRCEGLYNRGKGNPFFGKKHSEETLKSILSQIHSKPNGAERILIDFLRGFPFKYVGDGSLIIDGLNPDFINIDGKKQIIELFGHGFHDSRHKLKKGKIPLRQTEEGRKDAFRQFGFDTLIIWDTELKHKEAVIEKVAAFLKGGGKNVGNMS